MLVASYSYIVHYGDYICGPKVISEFEPYIYSSKTIQSLCNLAASSTILAWLNHMRPWQLRPGGEHRWKMWVRCKARQLHGRDVKLRRAQVFVKLGDQGKKMMERVDICSKFSLVGFWVKSFGSRFMCLLFMRDFCLMKLLRRNDLI